MVASLDGERWFCAGARPGGTSSRSSSASSSVRPCPGLFMAVKELNAKVPAFIDGWNDRSGPFVWTESADEVITKGWPEEDARDRPQGRG